MSRAKTNPLVAIVVFFSAILLFSQSATFFSGTKQAARPAAEKASVLTADGTNPPPVRRPGGSRS
jgi:hypothetical protein